MADDGTFDPRAADRAIAAIPRPGMPFLVVAGGVAGLVGGLRPAPLGGEPRLGFGGACRARAARLEDPVARRRGRPAAVPGGQGSAADATSARRRAAAAGRPAQARPGRRRFGEVAAEDRL